MSYHHTSWENSIEESNTDTDKKETQTINGFLFISVFLLYLVPFVLFIMFIQKWAPVASSFQLIAVGIILSTWSAILIVYIAKKSLFPSESKIPSFSSEKDVNTPSEPFLPEKTFSYQEEYQRWQQVIDQQKDQLDMVCQQLDEQTQQMSQLKAEKEELRRQLSQHAKETVGYEDQIKADLHHKERLIDEYRQIIQEQRNIIEKKQQQVVHLDKKVEDLTYEVKTLLQLESVDGNQRKAKALMTDVHKTEELYPEWTVSSQSKISSYYDAAILLQKCIDTAKQLTSIHHLGGKPSHFAGNTGAYAIDLRRLFDCFRNESTSIVLIYSIQEQKFVFANNQVKSLLGFPVDQFIKEFDALLVQGKEELKKAMHSFQSHHPASEKTGGIEIKLVIQNKQHKNILFHCQLDVIPTGPFSNFVIGVAYPV